LSDSLAMLENDLAKTGGFLSGIKEPDLGDLSTFGTLRAIEGLPVHQEIVFEREGPLPAWYSRMQGKVNR
jgi:hypothetical protein